MIIEKHKAIFVHVPKVAGQSIEHFFLEDLGATKSTALPYLVGPNPDLSRGPRHLTHLLGTDYTKFDYLSQEDFDSYFKFAFVRNPWERVVSFYKFLGFHSFISFEKFIVDYFSTSLWNGYRYWFIRPQTDYVLDENGNVIVDFIGRFENLNEDFQKVLKYLDFPPSKLPHINKSKHGIHRFYYTSKRNPELLLKMLFSKTDYHKNYQDYYSTKTKDIIDELYQKDIHQFNYKF